MQVYLAVTPKEIQHAAKYCPSLAHVAYRIGPDSALFRQNLLLQTRGGLLSVSDYEAPSVEDANALCAAVLRECSRRSYSGVLLDFEAPPRKDLCAFVTQLEKALFPTRRTLYLPESYAPLARHATVLIGTAVSGGTFTDRLQEASTRYNGANRLALDVQRVCADFRLPDRTGEGTVLSRECLQQMLKEQQPSVFFSQELCARYFTYSNHGETHFVLFDDANTLRQKIRIGKSRGFSAAFFMWPEINDLADSLFPLF